MFPEGRAFEFLIVAVVALIVVGPKDLPILLRKVGQFMAKVRSMAAEFRASFDEMARQSELDELRKEVEAMRRGQLTDVATHAPEVNQAFDDISQGLSDVGVQLNAPAAYPYSSAQTEHLEISVEAPAKRKAKPRKAAAGTAVRTTGVKKSAPAKTAPVRKASAKSKAAAPLAGVKAATPKAAPAKRPPAKPASAKPRARKAGAS